MKIELEANCLLNSQPHLVRFALEYDQRFGYDPNVGFENEDGWKMLDLSCVSVVSVSFGGKQIDVTEGEKNLLADKVWKNKRCVGPCWVVLKDVFQSLAENAVAEEWFSWQPYRLALTGSGVVYNDCWLLSEKDKVEHMQFVF